MGDILNEDLSLYYALEERISRSNELIEKLSRGNTKVKLLKTIPGIGEFFAVLIANEAVRCDSELGTYYRRLKARMDPNPAKIATTKLLATIIYRALKQLRPCYPGRAVGFKLPSRSPGGLD